MTNSRNPDRPDPNIPFYAVVSASEKQKTPTHYEGTERQSNLGYGCNTGSNRSGEGVNPTGNDFMWSPGVNTDLPADNRKRTRSWFKNDSFRSSSSLGYPRNI